MVGDLFKWVDLTVLLDHTWPLLIFCFMLSIFLKILSMSPNVYIQLLSKCFFLNIMKNTTYTYCIIMGTLCPLVITGISLDNGIRVVLYLQGALIILYILAFLLERR